MDFNEWLLEDRLHVIDITIIKDHHNFIINVLKPEKNKIKENQISFIRNFVLLDLFKKVADKYNGGTINDEESPIIISPEKGKDENDGCAEYDNNHTLIKFSPLKVCSDEWCLWYYKKFIERT